MTEFKLVEYSPKYAKAIADMWNVSKDGWNGEADHKTEEGVLRKEEISSHLNLYLALDGEKVIGYCKLSKYFAEENTLYVDLLNVDPAYHGKKAGKMLVKKSVERTIELGYPRIDLFTWAGNTKAVPMYKKCGFFWEQMEGGSTHLMNFIPTVVQAELFRDFFKKADWYDDSNRKIELTPDGVSENGFDYLTYSWQKNCKNLLVEFEKTGRGIRRIDTDDYSITASVIKNKLVFGKDYTISYEIVNKTGKKLEVEIKGLTDKNIKTKADFSGNIKGKKTVEAQFHLDKIEKDQSIWQTHPCAMSEISVNGKKITFKTGINPQFPLKLKANENYTLTHAEIEKDLLLNVENNFDEDCTFEIKFPKLKEIDFLEKKKSIFLKKGERNTVTVKIILHNSVLINKEIDLKAVFANGSSYTFRQKFNFVISTYDGKLYGENDYYYYMSFGKFSFSLDKFIDNNQMVYRSIKTDVWSYMGAPKLGKPFSSEFVRKAPYKSEYSDTDNAILLKAYYKSEDFPGCEFAQNFKMYRSGMLEQWYEMISFPAGSDKVTLSCELDIARRKVTVPYDGRIIKYDQNAHNDVSLDNMVNDKISENWMFGEREKGTVAVIWPKEYKIKLCSWFLSIEHSFSKKGLLKTKPVIFGVEVFDSEKEVREFALHKELEKERIYDSFDLEINAGNPFCDKKVSSAYIDSKDKPIDATVSISSVNDPAFSKVQTAAPEDKIHKIDFEFKFKGKHPVELITANADYHSRELYKTKAVFVKSKGEVALNKVKAEKKTVFTANNGVLEIKSSPEFAPSVFSLTYKGREWLATDYPERTNKSWWNSWFGGITNRPELIKEHHWLAENTKAAFVKKSDSLGNIWEGIALTTTMEKFDALRGVTVKQYFLMMPKSPVLAVYSEVINKSGYFLPEYHHNGGFAFINYDGDMKNIVSKVVEDGKESVIKSGYDTEEGSYKSQLITFRNKARSEMLHFFNGIAATHGERYTDNAVIMNAFHETHKVKNGQTKVLPPKFMIFSELELTEANLSDLQNVRF
jgi:GNAT superfamily N-acetyltransferase